MPVLTVCNHKGGTGKTTSAIHLAAAFGHAGRRVLAVDFDPQGFMTRMVGAEEPPPSASSLALLDPRADLRTIPVQHLSGFDLVGATMSLTKAQRQLNRPTDVFWLRETIQAGHDYDLILIDTAAALSVFTMNALVAADHVVIPVTPEYQPVVGAEQTWSTVGLVRSKLNPALSVPRFLLTQVDARLTRHGRYTHYLRERYDRAVLTTPIRTSSSLAVASKDGHTVFDARVATRGAQDYAMAAEEIGAYLFAEAPEASARAHPTPAPASGPADAPSSAAPEPSDRDDVQAFLPAAEGGGDGQGSGEALQPQTSPAAQDGPLAERPEATGEDPAEASDPRPEGDPQAGWVSLDQL